MAIAVMYFSKYSAHLCFFSDYKITQKHKELEKVRERGCVCEREREGNRERESVRV